MSKRYLVLDFGDNDFMNTLDMLGEHLLTLPDFNKKLDDTWGGFLDEYITTLFRACHILTRKENHSKTFTRDWITSNYHILHDPYLTIKMAEFVDKIPEDVLVGTLVVDFEKKISYVEGGL